MTAKERFDSFRQITAAFAAKRPDLRSEFFKLTDPKDELLPPVQEGEMLVTYAKRSRTASSAVEGLIFGDESGDSVFPGGLLWAAPLRDSGRLDIVVPPRRETPLKITVVSAIMKPTVPSTFESSGSRAASSDLLDIVRAGILSSSAKLSAKFTSLQNTEAAALELGISAKGWGAQLDATIRERRKSSQSVMMMNLEQAYFTLVCSVSEGETLFHERMFEDEGYADNLLELTKSKGELAIVNRVTYGRRFVLTFLSSASEEALSMAIRAGYSALGAGADASAITEHQRTLSQTQAILTMVGGKPDSDLTAGVFMPAAELLKAVSAYLKRTSNFDNETTPEVTTFSVRYAYDLAALVKADVLNFSEQVRKSQCPKGGFLNPKPIPIELADATTEAGDSEIDSDDWTYTRVQYQMRVREPERRVVELDVIYDAREGNSDKTFGDTWFRVTRTMDLFQLDEGEKRPIKSILSQRSGDVAKWYKGERGGWQEFQRVGALSNVKVSFDSGNDNDVPSMRIKFDVVLQLELNHGTVQRFDA